MPRVICSAKGGQCAWVSHDARFPTRHGMGLQVRDGRPSGWVDQHELVFERPLLAQVNRSHPHREVHVFISSDLLRAGKKRPLLLGKNQEVLLGPDDQTGSGPRLATAALEEPVVEFLQLCVDRWSIRRCDVAFGDLRHLARNEQIGRPIERGDAQRWPFRESRGDAHGARDDRSREDAAERQQRRSSCR